MRKRLLIPAVVMAMVFAFNPSSSFAAQKGQVNATSLNVRLENNSEASVISKLNEGDNVEIVETKDGWHKVKLSNGKLGWVSASYISTGGNTSNSSASKGYITGDNVNLRQGESMESTSMSTLSKGTEVEIISKNDEWYKVKANGKTGYVYYNLLDTKKSSSSKPVSRSENRLISLYQLANDQLGKKYVWGAQGPDTFDCSGFTSYVFKNSVGVKLPRNSTSQSKAGSYVSKDDLALGDLVFFDTDNGGSVNHVGIYLEDGDFIHASSAKKVVMVSSLDEGFYKKAYVTSRRFLD